MQKFMNSVGRIFIPKVKEVMINYMLKNTAYGILMIGVEFGLVVLMAEQDGILHIFFTRLIGAFKQKLLHIIMLLVKKEFEIKAT